MCPNCGHRLRRAIDEFGNWDGETYICDWCASADDDDDDDIDEDDERLSVSDAAAIWICSGKDEDYTFGYSEEELEKAL